MRYRQVGRSGLTVSVLGYGCIQFGRTLETKAAKGLVDAAINAGITLFDTANSYGEGGSEEILGAALKGRRDKVVVSTKFGSRRQRRVEVASASRRYIHQAVEATLTRLGTDYIDLFQLHFPDVKTPIEETLRALDDLVHAGKVRYIGASNFDGWQIVEAEWQARTMGTERFISVQRHYGLLAREIEQEVVPACERYGVGLIPWRPLENGILTGRYRPGDALPAPLEPRPPDAVIFGRLARLEAWASEHGVSLLEVAIGGLLGMPAVSAVLVGGSKPEQIRTNAAASDWVPTADDLAGVLAALEDPPEADA